MMNTINTLAATLVFSVISSMSCAFAIEKEIRKNMQKSRL